LAFSIVGVFARTMLQKLGGEETMEHLSARWPDAIVIATSGYDLQDTGHRFAVRPAGFLQKPYTAAQLTLKVAEVVRSRA
jgi:hypothetical protein